jgi:prefoldin subunit 5
MGAAAYNRGSKAIRQRIDDEQKEQAPLADTHNMIVRQYEEIQHLTEELDAARSEIVKARAAWEKRGIYLQTNADAWREARNDYEKRIDHLHKLLAQYVRTMDNQAQTIKELSTILRCVPRGIEAEARADARIYYPQAFKAN